MSKAGEAMAIAYRKNAERRISESQKRRRALLVYEQREAARLRDQQRLLRAAFYQRNPEAA